MCEPLFLLLVLKTLIRLFRVREQPILFENLKFRYGLVVYLGAGSIWEYQDGIVAEILDKLLVCTPYVIFGAQLFLADQSLGIRIRIAGSSPISIHIARINRCKILLMRIVLISCLLLGLYVLLITDSPMHLRCLNGPILIDLSTQTQVSWSYCSR